MLRFASSPTDDMHIGDLRVALYNYIIAVQRKEDLIVRIEDGNKEKNIDGKDQEILDILDLFGIKYSQTIYQSQNFRFHSAMALQLMHEKKAFSCFCSPEWLDKKRQEAEENNEEYKYDDACANLPAELVIDNLNPFTIRLKKPTEDIIVKDYLKGDITFSHKDMDSFVIMNVNKTPTYNFSCAVDDMLSDISIVVYAENHMMDIANQVHVRASLMYDKQIEYVSLPGILNESDKSSNVKWLLEEGFLPEAISNYLISIGNKTPKEIFTLDEASEWLSLESLSESAVSFDINALRDINKKHLKALDSKELSRYVGFADEEIGELAKVFLDEVSTTKELRSKIEPIFANKEMIPVELSEEVSTIKRAISTAPYFEEYDDFKNHIIKETSLEEKIFVQTLRYVLTGANDGPDISKIYKYLKNYIGEIVK